MAQINRECMQFLIDIRVLFLNIDQGAHGKAMAQIMYTRPLPLICFSNADLTTNLSECNGYSRIRWTCTENGNEKGE